MKYLIYLCLFLSTISANAEWKYRLAPELSYQNIYYPQEVKDTNNFSNLFRLNTSFKFKYNKWLQLNVLHAGSIDTSGRSNEEKYFSDLKEGYADIRFSSDLSLQLGNQIFNWGITDGITPTNVINAQRFIDPINTDKLGATSAVLQWSPEPFIIELIYIPWQKKSILPGTESRWLPRSKLETRSLNASVSGFDDVVLVFPDYLTYTYLSDEELDDALSNNIASRIRGKFHGIDLALNFFQGVANAPAIVTATTSSSSSITNNVLTLQIDDLISLTPIYYKTRMIGGSIVYTWSPYILRYEVAFHSVLSTATNKGLPDDYHHHALGIERTFYWGEQQSLTAILQFSYAKHKDEDTAENTPVGISRVFDKAAMTALRYIPAENWTIMTSYLYDTEYKNQMLIADIDHRVIDNLNAGLSASLFMGEDLTPLGTYDKNDFVSFRISYAF